MIHIFGSGYGKIRSTVPKRLPRNKSPSRPIPGLLIRGRDASLMMTSGGRYNSLAEIARHTGLLNIPAERWGGEPTLVVQDGRVVWPDIPPTLLVHWAGEWHRAREEKRPLPHHALWDFYRYM